jgi:hypothetical protein
VSCIPAIESLAAHETLPLLWNLFDWAITDSGIHIAQPSEYTKIIATLLNDGTSPATGKQILKKATVDEMFSNQIPNMPNFGRQEIQNATPELTNKIGELYPQPHDQPQGWGTDVYVDDQSGGHGERSQYRMVGWTAEFVLVGR